MPAQLSILWRCLPSLRTWRRTERSTSSSVCFSLVNILTTWLQVFGEALLNDGVTFVLYEGVKELAFVEAEDIKNIPVQHNF